MPTFDIGDEILEFNDIPIETYRNFYRVLAHGSNIAAVERNVNDLMVKGPNDKMSIKLKKKDNSIITYECRRDFSNYDSFNLVAYDIKPWRDTTLKEGCSFGIINMTKFHPATDHLEMLDDIWKKNAWIIDLRGQISIDFSLLAPFIYPDTISYYFHLEPNLNIPGEFYSRKNTSIRYL